MAGKKLRTGAILALVLAAAWAAGGEEKSCAVIDMEGAKELEGAWSAPADEEGAACRSLAAGSRGTVNISAWWKGKIRPPEGTAYRVEIEFKDTARSPATVDVYAGLPNWRRVHRIGGHGDNTWKTAVIPLPWDMVMRVPGKDYTSLAIQAPGDGGISVRAIRVVKGDPDRDERRWAAETREWVGRVQADKRSRAKRPAAEEAVLDFPYKQWKAVPFTRSWMRPIEMNSAPMEGETGGALVIRMARNETEPAQFGIYANGGDLLGCTVDVAPNGLRDRRGKALKAGIELMTAEYAVQSGGELRAQRLWPAYPVDIRSGESHMFMMRVTTEAGESAPGKYRGEIAIRAEAVEAKLAVEVEVLPVKLVTMQEAGFHLAMCCDRLLPRHEMAYMVRHNMPGLCFFTYTIPIELKKRSSTEFDIDLSVADDFMANARKAGITSVVYYLGGDPYGFPDTLQLERELYRRVHYNGSDMMAGRIELLKKTAAAPDRLLPEVRPLYKKWAAKFMSHAEKAGWPEIYLSPFDEPAKWSQGGWGGADFYIYKDPGTGWDALPHISKRDAAKWLAEIKGRGIEPEFICSGGAGEWIRGHFKDSCAAIHEAWPRAKIYGSIHHAGPGIVFRDDIDIFCSDAIHEDREMGTKVRASGDPRKEFWLYDFSRDTGDPANMRYIFGFFHAAFGTTGALCWAYNWDADFDTSGGGGPSVFGNTTPYGVAIQPDFEGFREAWDDRRYIETYRREAARRGKAGESAAFLEKLGLKAGRKRAEGTWDNVEFLYRETGDRNALDTMRGEVVKQMLGL
ncbi:MAG: hypothetical protein JW909_09605 [Planctomycetes bacterium]|nr:hypothetical protein [Planctomycetota bacterium]